MLLVDGVVKVCGCGTFTPCTLGYCALELVGLAVSYLTRYSLSLMGRSVGSESNTIEIVPVEYYV